MLMNNAGRAKSFKETDIRVEQFNKSIKSHAHGVNARPALPEKITPAMGIRFVWNWTLTLRLNTTPKVRQDSTVLLGHLCTEGIFDFAADTPSQHAVIDLYRGCMQRLAGPAEGGHAKHLRRHYLRFRTPHENDMPPT
ncbi:hypothetical protein B0H14DRAFT_2177599, partial [Mycena olivaceomarginata]